MRVNRRMVERLGGGRCRPAAAGRLFDHGGPRGGGGHEGGSRARQRRGCAGRLRAVASERRPVDGSASSTTAIRRHQVVCGAPNVAPGIEAPFARVGRPPPGRHGDRAAELRNVASAGMLCSGKELEIPDDVDGLLELPTPMRRSGRRSRSICASTMRYSRSTLRRTGATASACSGSRARSQHAMKRRCGHSKRRFPQPRCATRSRSSSKPGARCPRFAGRIVRGRQQPG